MKLDFDNDFQLKIMRMSFLEPAVLSKSKDILEWRMHWMNALKSWHSPYKALINLEKLSLGDVDQKILPELKAEFERMLKFLEGLFLRKACAFGCLDSQLVDLLPFEHFNDEVKASETLGIRSKGQARTPGNLRESITIENHFRQHVMELSFINPVVLTTVEELGVLKSKITNALMQWHSKWSLIIDCTNFEIEVSLHDEFEKMEKYFRGFFMKNIVGYSPIPDKTYPFKVYRARHKAAAQLEGEGNNSGDEAVCRSTGKSPSKT